MSRGEEGDEVSEPPQKIQRLSVARIHHCLHIGILLTNISQIGTSLGEAPGDVIEPPIAPPSPEQVIQERRSTRAR
jgi:hypothetical protein